MQVDAEISDEVEVSETPWMDNIASRIALMEIHALALADCVALTALRLDLICKA